MNWHFQIFLQLESERCPWNFLWIINSSPCPSCPWIFSEHDTAAPFYRSLTQHPIATPNNSPRPRQCFSCTRLGEEKKNNPQGATRVRRAKALSLIYLPVPPPEPFNKSHRCWCADTATRALLPRRVDVFQKSLSSRAGLSYICPRAYIYIRDYERGPRLAGLRSAIAWLFPGWKRPGFFRLQTCEWKADYFLSAFLKVCSNGGGEFSAPRQGFEKEAVVKGPYYFKEKVLIT